jgi:hypothetical protein
MNTPQKRNREEAAIMRYELTMRNGARAIVTAPDPDVARYRAERAGWKVARVAEAGR